jgi:DNA gyrase subunit A
LGRDSKGRAIVNLLNLEPGEQIAQCLAIRDFNQPGHFVMMATTDGLVKKTPLEQYSRPKKGGIIAIKLREGDSLVDAAVVGPENEVVLVTAGGMAIRFNESDARPMGRNTSGVKGIRLSKGDSLVGMVVADPDATLLTVCENGFGKRTYFGPNAVVVDDEDANVDAEGGVAESTGPDEPAEESTSSSARYRTQRRGGKGVRDIRTSKRNGKVISIARVTDGDEIFMMTAKGKIQRIKAADINIIGRNTQGVRIMNVDEGDSLIAIVRVPPEETSDEPVVETVLAPEGPVAEMADQDVESSDED